MILPEPYVSIYLTYLKDGEKVIKKGFYSSTFDEFSVPPEWRIFNGMDLPHGFGGERIKNDKILKWEYYENSK